ncbi:FecR domain-containing protein [Candidatus Gracilibacteria bacterium]|nr:FecR domain-containing protein [Candidatus Gracilibacteria bacterium]
METEKETDRVEKILAAVAVPSLDARAKARLKDRIFMRLDYPIAESLREAASNTHIGLYDAARIKESVFAIISQKKQKWFFWENFFALQKKLFAGALAVMMSFSVFSFLSFDASVARADSFTVLNSYKGYVSVLRDGNVLQVSENMRLQEKDQIVTGNDGYAAINFFDDSVSRLSSDTVVVLNKLDKVDDSKVRSYIELSLKGGRLWTRVLNLVQSHSSFTVEANELYVTAKKAAFNVAMDDEKTDVQVFNHVVDISGVPVNKAVSGQKVTMDNNKNVSVEVLSNTEKSDDWVTTNLSDDKKYLADTEERLLVAKIESVGGNPNNVSFENSLQENAVLFLTFDDVKSKKIELDLSEKNFVTAQLVLSSADSSEEEKQKAMKAVDEFSADVKNFYEFVKSVSSTDEKYADELNKYVEDKILAQKKSLSLVLPDSPLYTAKVILDDLETSGNLKPEDLVAIKMDNALGKLSDAQEVVTEEGKEEAFDIAFEGYKSDVKDVITVIQEMPADQEVKDKLAEKVISDIDFAKSVTKTDDGIIELKTAALEVKEVGDVVIAEVEKTEEVVNNNKEVGSADVSDVVDVVDVVATSAVPEAKTDEQKNSDEYGVKMEGDKVLPPLMGK